MTKWSWPLPNCVPWRVPTGDTLGAFGTQAGITLFAPLNHPVCAVEDGTVVAVFNRFNGQYEAPEGSHAILIEGESGVVAYCGVSVVDILPVGMVIFRGVEIGSVHPMTKRLTIELYRHGYRGQRPMADFGPQLATSWPQPDCLLDPTPFMVQAWTRVTRQFHRSVTPPPESKFALVQDIKNHPLWSYPVTVRIPNGPNASLDDMSNWTPKVLDAGGGFYECVDTEFVYVDPTLEMIIDGDDIRNQNFRVWVEAGGWVDVSKDPNHPVPSEGWTDHNKWYACHDLNLDCGAATAEDALVELAQRVKWYYDGRNPREDVPVPCGGTLDAQDQYKTLCVDDGDGFCTQCGYLVRYPWDDKDA